MSDPQALNQMLTTPSPIPQREYVFAFVDKISADTHPFVMVRDDDVLTAVLKKSEAEAVGLPVDKIYVHLSLGLQADLNSIGVTAAITQIPSARFIVANPIAYAHHDHFFVQADHATGATQPFIELGKNTRGWLPHN